MELKNSDAAYANSKFFGNKRFISTQFGNTLDLCETEMKSLRIDGFKPYTKVLAGYSCIIDAELDLQALHQRV